MGEDALMGETVSTLNNGELFFGKVVRVEGERVSVRNKSGDVVTAHCEQVFPFYENPKMTTYGTGAKRETKIGKG